MSTLNTDAKVGATFVGLVAPAECVCEALNVLVFKEGAVFGRLMVESRTLVLVVL